MAQLFNVSIVESTLIGYENFMNLFNDYLETPLGDMEVRANNHAIKSIYFVEKQTGKNPNNVTAMGVEQLNEYFSGQRYNFDLPLAPDGTAFQQQVWQALTTIEYARTCSYSDIAEVIHNPKAVRAVGAANGRNPLTIVVPCHRIIGRDGSLTGYAFGLARKAWLLKHESEHSLIKVT